MEWLVSVNNYVDMLRFEEEKRIRHPDVSYIGNL